jgi:hypothetical protein
MILTWRRRRAQAYIETGLGRVVYGAYSAAIITVPAIPVNVHTSPDAVQSATQIAVHASTFVDVKARNARIE